MLYCYKATVEGLSVVIDVEEAYDYSGKLIYRWEIDDKQTGVSLVKGVFDSLDRAKKSSLRALRRWLAGGEK